MHFIFEGLEGDIVGGCTVVVIGFEERFGIVEAMAVGRQLQGDGVDESEHLVSCDLDFLPQFVADVDLLAEIMVKLGTDGLEQLLLQLGNGEFVDGDVEKQVLGCGALEEEGESLVGLKANGCDDFLALLTEGVTASLIQFAVVYGENRRHPQEDEDDGYRICQDLFHLSHILLVERIVGVEEGALAVAFGELHRVTEDGGVMS